MDKWDLRFMQLAKIASSWSKDPDCKVGVALVSNDTREFALGYNGFPVDIDRTGLDKAQKNALTVHAEVNAILNARRNLSGWSIYCTKAPCLDCAKAIIQAGIIEVICLEPDANSSWYAENLVSIRLLKQAQIRIFLARHDDLKTI